uniref:G-protein coupled receptors family 1 profile domain-containing protein n=1 Tax=Esox lucius TaxID=8010 RepID=A0A6Q2XA38_ESOLU
MSCNKMQINYLKSYNVIFWIYVLVSVSQTYFSITLYVFFTLISVVTVFLNLLVIISISYFKHLHTATNLIILSLAVSDLLVGLLAIPAMTVAIMEPCWVFGGYFCALLLYTNFLCETSSLGNLVLISIDRYVAICDPLMYHQRITITKMKCWILMTWSFCIIYEAVLIKIYVNVEVPSGCFEECYSTDTISLVSLMDLVIIMIVPCSIIITLYLKIFVVARSQARQVFFSKRAASVFVHKTVQANKSERKAAKTLGIVVFNYLIFWNPFLYIYFLTNYSLTSFIISNLPLLSSFVNPIIYAFFYPWFRMTAKHILSLKL